MIGIARVTMILALSAATWPLTLPAHAQQHRKIDVPVMLGGDADFDACGSSGVIVGLDPKGDELGHP